ncbi:MAG: TIGR02281 family clan AA aspartic protease [Sphingobium sp.]
MNDGDSIARFVWIVLVLLFVASSLFARRIPLARLVGWSLGWVALFFGAYLLFDWISPELARWQQSRRGGDVRAVETGAQPGPAAISSSNGGAVGTSGRAVAIPMNEDGHFWVTARVNGRGVRFLVDSGASITALSRSSADRLGLTIDPLRGGIVMQTANGAVKADRSSIALIEIEEAIRASDLPVVVSESFGTINVLGMNFLNKLKSWRVEDGRMILEAR